MSALCVLRDALYVIGSLVKLVSNHFPTENRISTTRLLSSDRFLFIMCGIQQMFVK